MDRKAKEWLREVSFIVVTISLRRELNGPEDTQNGLIRSLVRRNIEDKEGNTDERRKRIYG